MFAFILRLYIDPEETDGQEKMSKNQEESINKKSSRFNRELAIERACYCPSYSPSKIRIQEYFVCDPPKPPLDICEECPINNLREPSTIVIATYTRPGELEDVEEEDI